MTGRSLYQLLLEAMQNSRPSMLPDQSAEIAMRYPQGGVPDSARSEAQSPLQPAVASLRDPNFRQLSRAPFAAQAQPSDASGVQLNSPDYLWTAPPQNAGLAGGYGDRPTLPWWAPPPPPMLPVPGRTLALPRPGGVGVPTPLPGSTTTPKIPMPEIPEAWKIFGSILMLYPELVRERLLGGRGESKEDDAAPAQILELYSSRGSGSKTWRDAKRAFNRRHYEMCDQQKNEEVQRCYDAIDQHPERNYSEYPYRDWLQGCKDRAEDRRTICRKTGEIPAWPAEWGPADEENWFNVLR